MSNARASSWPPAGWPDFELLTQRECQAIIKDPSNAKVRGLSYRVQSAPLSYDTRRGKQSVHIHSIRIDSWEYTIQHEGSEKPILTFGLKDRVDRRIPVERLISNVKIMGCPIRTSRRTVKRLLPATGCLMRQIAAGQVVDAENILKIYALHPDQGLGLEYDKKQKSNLFSKLRSKHSDQKSES